MNSYSLNPVIRHRLLAALSEQLTAQLWQYPLRIYIAGPSASCKSVYGRALSELLNLKYVSGSNVLLRNMGRGDVDWLRDREALNMARRHGVIDRLTDVELIDVVGGEQRIVIDSWTLPWIAPLREGDVRIWFEIDSSVRARNMMRWQQDALTDFTETELELALLKKDADSFDRYLDLYGFAYGNCRRTFDVTLNITQWLATTSEDLPAERQAVMAALLSSIARHAAGAT